MNEIKLSVHLPDNSVKSARIELNDSVADFLINTLKENSIPGKPEDFIITDASGKKIDTHNNVFAKTGLRNNDQLFIKANGGSNDPYEDTGDITALKTFHQLGILVLDGSGSMTLEGNNKISLADQVNRAVREFLGEFKNISSQVVNISIAVISFDETATLHTPPTPLETINDLADYTPTEGHGGKTNIGVALEMAEQVAIRHLQGPDAGNIPCMVSIILMSDGMCLNPDYTRLVTDRIKSSAFQKKGDLTLCTTFFKSNQLQKDEEEQAKNLLMEIASEPKLFIVSYNYDYLRKFFVGSMTAKRSYGK